MLKLMRRKEKQGISQTFFYLPVERAVKAV
jgi:hypothetical protein